MGKIQRGGAKQLLSSVQKYIIAVQHDSKAFECKKEDKDEDEEKVLNLMRKFSSMVKNC